MAAAVTVGSQFRQQMNELMEELLTTTPHYVRCVKPNELRFAGGFNAGLIHTQLTYLGVLETVRIRRAGYPIRRKFEEFFKQFEFLSRPHRPLGKRSARELCELILTHAHQMDPNNWQLGKERVFLRDGQLAVLMSASRHLKKKSAIAVQRIVKGRLTRHWYAKTLVQVVQLQSWTRARLRKKQYLTTIRRFVKLQSIIRYFFEYEACWNVNQYKYTRSITFS